MRALHAAGLVTSRRDGTRVYYPITTWPRVCSNGAWTACLSKRLMETAKLLPDLSASFDCRLGRGEALNRALRFPVWTVPAW